MARKKPAPAPKGRPPSPRGPKRHILGMRGTDEYKEWLRRFADSERSDIVDLVDDAVAFYARHRKFEMPPKR